MRKQKNHDKKTSSTVLAEEVEQFSRLADQWWDEDGPFKPLHRLNPVRIAYIRDQICNHFGRDRTSFSSLKGLSILDVGCGGGLVTEPLARLGAKVTGLDASPENCEAASSHAKKSGLEIQYLCDTAENLAATNKKFDVVLALEIVEHVANPPLFLSACTQMVKKDGLFILSTLNRTTKSFALGIVAAEYILRWLPRGTHDWRKFLKPSEIAAQLRDMQVTDVTGLSYSPLNGTFSLDKRDIKTNYLMTATY